MAGNWIDNSACLGEVGGVRAVFAGSHDYNVWAFRAADGEVLWKRNLGGEVFSAPAFFAEGGAPMLAVASLDNHLYVLDARDGRVVTAYFTGQPLWDKVAKGEVLWGSPAVLVAGRQTAVVHGSFNGEVYALPLYGECELRTKVQSAATLWWGLLATFVLFAGVVLPVVLNLKARRPAPR
jgi:outer membrane protein assembly factor BamB